MTLGYPELRERIDALRNQQDLMSRRRIRSVMNGGQEGVQAILGWDANGPAKDLQDLGVDLPTANLMWSGLEKLSQMIGRAPTLKTDMLPIKDNKAARDKAEKRGRIVQGWDDLGRAEMQYPQIGRWLPGYGFVLHVIKEQTEGGHTYPVAELRDPYDVYPGFWGPNQQPTEVVSIRRVEEKWLRRQYPGMKVIDRSRRTGIYILGQSNWEGTNTQLEVAEYIDSSGTYLVSLDTEEILTFVPNPLSSGPAFVMTKRFSFDRLGSQYEHVFGLMAMMARLNILGLMGTEDTVFRETNVYGEMDSVEYLKGRDAINFFQQGTRVEKPTEAQLNQLWQGVNIVERQFRIVGGYDVAQDGQSPNSFATGAGIEQLGESRNQNVKEYQTAIKHSAELIDRKRLEWEDAMHPTKEKRVYWYEGGNSFEEKYVAGKDIDGDYRTRRVFGAMATFDETQKILAGLQLQGAGILDRRTVQENLDGLDNIGLVNERIIQDGAFRSLMGALDVRAQGQDPAALAALYGVYKNPKNVEDELETALGLNQEELLAQGGAPNPADALAQGAPPDGTGARPPVQSVLSQLEGATGGAQTVATR